MTIGTLGGWDRRSLVFRAASPSGSLRARTITTPQRRRGDKTNTLLRPRRKAQEVVEEPRRQVVVLRRQMEAI